MLSKTPTDVACAFNISGQGLRPSLCLSVSSIFVVWHCTLFRCVLHQCHLETISNEKERKWCFGWKRLGHAAPSGFHPDLIRWLFHHFMEKKKEKKKNVVPLKGWQRAREQQREAGSDREVSRQDHEGGTVLPFLLSLVSRARSRWLRRWKQRISSVVADAGTWLRVVQASTCLWDVWGRRHGAASRTRISGAALAGAPDADPAVQPERRLSPQDFSRWNREWWQAGKWPVRWGMLGSFRFHVAGSQN